MPSDHIYFLEVNMKEQKLENNGEIKSEKINKNTDAVEDSDIWEAEESKNAEKEKPQEVNNDTELVFIIDRSGSMACFVDDTVGGFNSMIEKQKKEDGKVYVSTVLFNTYREVIHDRIDINEVKPMTENDYSPCGCTALLDAIGHSIRHISNIHKYARREDVPKNTIFVITTDGMENSSHRYDSDKIKEMIKEYTEERGWEFIFVAANIDAVETAKNIGIRKERAANYRQNKRGIEDSYDAMSMFVSYKRMQAPEERLAMWKSKLD